MEVQLATIAAGDDANYLQELAAAQTRLAAQPPTQAFSPLQHTRMLTKPRSFSGREADWGHMCDGKTSAPCIIGS